MKKLLYISILGALLLGGCSKWLDVSPEDQVNEDAMFETGDGYRIALNGVYSKMAETSLYGREMTWGMIDVMGRMYKRKPMFGSTYYIPKTHAYYKAYECLYTDKDVKSIVEGIWSYSYNAVTNCNKIIDKIKGEDALKFGYGEMERQMILGEALAVRAYLQFDMLRLFAPAPIMKPEGKYIPYYDSYGSHGNPYLTVDQTLEKIIKDLKDAQDALGHCDTIAANKVWMSTPHRILSEGTTQDLAKDIFFAYRGYRMNYYAATATLARVYNYAHKYELAAAEAQEVIDAKYVNGSAEENCFQFTSSGELQAKPRYYDGVIFALGRNKLDEDYSSYSKSSKHLYLVVDQPSYSEEDDDQRKGLVYKGTYTFYSKLFAQGNITDDMLPLIRLSEMYYIVAENMYRSGQTAEAIHQLDLVRMARGVQAGGLSISSLDGFISEMLRDAKKDFPCEGQMFFQNKRVNKTFDSKTNFVLELPDSEKIN